MPERIIHSQQYRVVAVRRITTNQGVYRSVELTLAAYSDDQPDVVLVLDQSDGLPLDKQVRVEVKAIA